MFVVLAALVLMHLIALHEGAGSTNPLGISGNSDRIAFAPYFLFKDLVTIFIFILVLSIFIFFMPNALGDSENYIPANPLSTPAAIVPEWWKKKMPLNLAICWKVLMPYILTRFITL